MTPTNLRKISDDAVAAIQESIREYDAEAEEFSLPETCISGDCSFSWLFAYTLAK